MLTYDYIENSNRDILKIIVKLDRKKIGEIRQNSDKKWQYFPNGKKIGGEQFKHFSQVQKTLETDE